MIATATEVSGVIAALDALRECADDAERIDRIRQLEDLKSAVAAVQAAVTASFVMSQRAEQIATGVPAEQARRGIAAQVALARRISPHAAQRYVGWSMILTSELPEVFRALRAGATSEWRAMLVARETAWLSREHRAEVDRDLAARISELGDKRVEDETKKAAYRLDPHGYLDRIRSAENDRRVTVRVPLRT